VNNDKQPALIPDPPLPVVIQSDPPPGKREVKSAVETHPRREEIIRDITGGGMSNRAIAEKYGISHGAVNRYKNGKLLPLAAEAARERGEGMSVMARLVELIERVEMLFDSCDEYLRDPDNPGKYTLCPRSEELDVVYWEPVQEGDKIKKVARKALLSSLLDRVSNPLHVEIVAVYYRGMDIRKLAVDVSKALVAPLELLAKIQGAVKDTVNNQINVVILPGKEEREVTDERRG
jgi:transposase